MFSEEIQIGSEKEFCRKLHNVAKEASIVNSALTKFQTVKLHVTCVDTYRR